MGNECENWSFVILKIPQGRKLSQREKVSLIGKTIGKECLTREVGTQKQLFECVQDVGEANL